MKESFCIACCSRFEKEMAAALSAMDPGEARLCVFPANCTPIRRSDLPEDCARTVVFGGKCIADLQKNSRDTQVRLDECLELVAGKAMVSDALKGGAFLLSPAMLENPPVPADASELVLFDTGILADSGEKLSLLSARFGIPARKLSVGLDFVRLRLEAAAAQFRYEELKQDCSKEIANHVSAMDFLGKLVLLKGEEETIGSIGELFGMLFAPSNYDYFRFENGLPENRKDAPSLDGNWSWTESGRGFILRISDSEETLGIILADELQFPEYREAYLDLALSMSGVLALAIENARTFTRFVRSREALRKSEHSMKLAQALGHIGHWEWDMVTGEMAWSDETYRILGYEPRTQVPNRQRFLETVHPEDREKVEAMIARTLEGEKFDMEYRIVLPDSRIRVLHGIGEIIYLGQESQPKLMGTIADVTSQSEVLGVIQDITERKAVETRLAREANTDALTGCANRRHFLNRAKQEIARSLRYGGTLSVLMLDLDHFKSVNDVHGHHAGDLTLQRFVSVCQETIREEDFIGRLGGEEFAILLPQTDREMAIEAAERIRLAVEKAEVRIDAGTLHFTASIGVATRDNAETGIETMLERADEALYLAKNRGRNRVESA